MAGLNSAIELHDSTLASFQQTDQQIVIVFSPAYIHKSEGSPGVDAGTGWVQDAIIRIEAGTIEAAPLELPCDILDGELQVDNSQMLNMLPVPLDCEGNVEFKLTSWNESRLVVRGTRIEVELIGDSRYVEDFRKSPSK